MFNLDDLLNQSVESFIAPEPEKVQKQPSFQPNPKNTKTGVYSAVVRFLPNRYDTQSSSFRSVQHWLESDDDKGYFQCQSMIGLEPCFVNQIFWKYKNDKENAVAQEIAKKLGRQEQWYSSIYVVNDLSNPENNGKTLVWKYGIKIKRMIDAQMKPSDEDLKLGNEPCNIFNLGDGKNFTVKVKTVGGYSNYDDCKFADSKSAFSKDVNGKVNILNSVEVKTELSEILENSPNLGELYGFKPWTAEQEEKARRIVSYITGQEVDSLLKSGTVGTKTKSVDVSTVKSSTISTNADSESTGEELDEELEAYLNA
jgi:Tat protein secretion system quality control protein TatD with DNase activity